MQAPPAPAAAPVPAAAPAPKPVAPPKAPKAPKDDRFKAELDKMKQNAAFGINVMDVLKAQSGGTEDYSKDIQFSIRREYFTFKQVVEIAYWCMTMGAVIGAMTVAILTPNGIPDFFGGEESAMVWGVMLLSFGISMVFSDIAAVRNVRKCTRKKWKKTDRQVREAAKTGGDPKAGQSKVEPEYQGRDCFTDWDCTRSSSVSRGVCELPKPNWLFRIIRNIFAPLCMLGGIFLTAMTFSQTDFRPPKKDVAQAVIYGVGFGSFAALFFS